MSWIAVAVAGASLTGAIIQSNAASEASSQAINEQRTQFQGIQTLLSPYVEGGEAAFEAQQDLVGLGGQASQAEAIQQIQDSPQFQAMEASGQNAILQNASATGGLRGGNTQAALAQFSPALLGQTIDRQFQNLGGLAQTGQASAAGVGAAGQQTGSNVSNLLGQQALTQGQIGSNLIGGFGQAAGTFLGQQGSPGAVNQGQASLQQEFALPKQQPFLKSTF